jgi:hypothetical protein
MISKPFQAMKIWKAQLNAKTLKILESYFLGQPVSLILYATFLRSFKCNSNVLCFAELSKDKISNQNTLSTKKCISLNMENLNCWNQFLDNLQVKKLWKSSRSNLKAIKSNMIEVKFHLKVPILIVAIKKILELDSTSSSDIFCVMQDPTGICIGE